MARTLQEKLEHKIKTKILGKDFLLSIAYIDDEKMKILNKSYRKKNKTTDILSFKLDSKTGEILISKKEAAKKGLEVPYLLIHGMLHLKGLRHSAIMDRQEKKFCKLFSIKYPFDEIKNNSRNRHRNISNQGGGGRGSTRI